MIDWGLLQTPNFSQALLGGMQAGRAMARQRKVDDALALYPTKPQEAVGALIGAGEVNQAAALTGMIRDQRRSDLVRAVLGNSGGVAAAPGQAVLSGNSTPSGVTPSFDTKRPGPTTLGALIRSQGSQPSPTAQMAPSAVDVALPANTAMTAPALPQPSPAPTSDGSPMQVVDPASLPARTDGLTLNQDALRQLYAEDPEAAHQLQTYAYNANKQQFDHVKSVAQVMGNVAFRLGEIPADQRPAELQAYKPLLRQYGLSDGDIDAADLSDNGLLRLRSLAQSYTSLVDDNRQERRLTADIDNMDADNERADRDQADRSRDRTERRGLIARGQDLTDARGRYGIDVASGDRRRGQNIASTDRRRAQDLGPRARGSTAAPPVIHSRAEYSRLPSGAVFVGPDGKQRTKP